MSLDQDHVPYSADVVTFIGKIEKQEAAQLNRMVCVDSYWKKILKEFRSIGLISQLQQINVARLQKERRSAFVLKYCGVVRENMKNAYNNNHNNNQSSSTEPQPAITTTSLIPTPTTPTPKPTLTTTTPPMCFRMMIMVEDDDDDDDNDDDDPPGEQEEEYMVKSIPSPPGMISAYPHWKPHGFSMDPNDYSTDEEEEEEEGDDAAKVAGQQPVAAVRSSDRIAGKPAVSNIIIELDGMVCLNLQGPVKRHGVQYS